MDELASILEAALRLLAAGIAGAAIGAQRESSGKHAGLRTHMLVALGTASLVIACLEFGMDEDALSRVIQGLVTGIGFLGAGAILKIQGEREIMGLTTASGIWLTTGASIAIGLGQFVVAAITVVLAWIVLAVFLRIERRLLNSAADENSSSSPPRAR